MAVESIAKPWRATRTVYFTPQNIAEFWNVATRPTDKNGLGLPHEVVIAEIDIIEELLTLLPDSAAVYREWKRLVTLYQVIGSKVYDARLVAVANVYNIPSILTFNISDFKRYSDVTVLEPSCSRRGARQASAKPAAFPSEFSRPYNEGTAEVGSAPVAQLDSAIDFESIGREFEPLRARQTSPATNSPRQPGGLGLYTMSNGGALFSRSYNVYSGATNINSADSTGLVTQFDTAPAASSTAPEPGSLLLLGSTLIGGVVLMRFRNAVSARPA